MILDHHILIYCHILPYVYNVYVTSKTMAGQRSQRSQRCQRCQRSGQGHQRQRLEGCALTSVESEGFEVREGLPGMALPKLGHCSLLQYIFISV